MSKKKLTTEKFSMVFLVVAGTVVVLLDLFYLSTGFYVVGLLWIFLGLGYVKQKAYTKHLAVALLIFGSVVASLGWYPTPSDATHAIYILITTTGMAMFTGRVINLITYAYGK